MAVFGGKKETFEEVINLKEMDAATCNAIQGQLNEHGECLIRATKQDDLVVLKPLRYKRPGVPISHEE